MIHGETVMQTTERQSEPSEDEDDHEQWEYIDAIINYRAKLRGSKFVDLSEPPL